MSIAIIPPHPRFDNDQHFLAAAAENSTTKSRSGCVPLKHFLALLLLGGALLWPNLVRAATLPAGFVETDVGGYWDGAAGITFDAVGTMYQWDRDGHVWVFQNGARLNPPLVDISEEVGNWGDYGLLGFALDPDFLQNGYLYLLYVVDHYYLTRFGTPSYNSSGNEYFQATIGRITRYTARASDNFHSVDPASRTILVGESASTGFPIIGYTHGVGTLLFGTDGTLLASCGDGAELSDSGSNPSSYYAQALSEGILKPKENIGAFRSQLVDSFSGKIVRIDKMTGNGIPSNPFYDPANPRAPRSRVWALGLRNPFRITLKPGTGEHIPSEGNPGVLYIGDVGYYTWEKMAIDKGPGMNFGWPVYEGFDETTSYDGLDPSNLDAPNPLYGTGGCAQQYFTFRDLLKEATLGTPSWPNPCNTALQVPNSIPHFVHTRPIIDWYHGSSGGPSRTGIFIGTNAAVINIGASGSPVSGPQFDGNCSIGGTWYQGINFPAQYQNTYFFADFDHGWIRNFVFDSNDQPVSVSNFATDVGGLVQIVQGPDDALYYINVYYGVFKITYGGNHPPKAVASADVIYGTSPLTVHFTGSGSSDADGNPLTYRWDFGDGSAISTAANPTHAFSAPAGVPTGYTVTLTVTDSASATDVAKLLVAVNDTPPSVAITSPINGSKYPITGDTAYNLTANVTDAQSSDSQLLYQWQTILHHNNHEHVGVIDTNHVTTTVTAPVGCDADTYFYRIVLIVTDPSGLSATNEVDLYPDCTGGNTPPTISDIGNQTINQNTSTGPIGFTVGDAETAAGSLSVSGSSSNPTLVPSGNIAFGGSGASRTLTVTPAANQSGTATITVTVSDGSLTAGDTFVLTVVSPNNTPPTISSIANQTINEDTATGAISFTVGDAETAAGSLTVSGSSSNPALAPNGNIVFGGSGASRTVTVTPANNQNGTATITVSVSDGQASTSTNFVLTVNAVNDAPTISSIADQTINQDTSAGPISFTVGDVETAAGSLTVSGSSSNPTLVPNSNIVFGGSGASRTVTVTPAAGLTGTATITVTVNDGSLTATATFTLTVNSSTAPTYLLSEGFEGAGFENSGWTTIGTPNADYTTTVLDGLQSLNCGGGQAIQRTFAYSNAFYMYFQVRWVTYSPYQTFISWRSTDLNQVAEFYCNGAGAPVDVCHGGVCAAGTTPLTAGTTYHVWVEWTKGSGANGTMKLFVSTTATKPASPEVNITSGNGAAVNQITLGPESSGNVILDRILVDDVPIGSNPGATQNQPPTISNIANQTINEDAPTGAISFTVGDAETAAGSLTVSGSSSNPTLAPNGNIVFGGSGASRTVTVTPATNQNGSATITLTVSDGQSSTSTSFGLTVNAVNDAPTISNLANQTINEDTQTGAISFTVGDVETAAGSLTVSGSSSNPTLVHNGNIVFGGSGASRTVTVTPAANQNGTATITVTVSDGQASTSTSFGLTVNAVNDAPTISNILDQTINQDSSTSAISFTVGDVETAAGSLTVSGSSSNPTLVPNGNIVFGGSGASRTVTVTPAAGQTGTATITVTVSDGALTASDTFVLMVNPSGNTPPTISGISNVTINEDSSTGAIAFTVGDAETAAGSLTVSGSSSNPTLVPNGNIIFGGSGASRTVTVTPATNQNGTATITVSVSDGQASAGTSFVLTVNAVNDAPTISSVANQTINEDAATGAIAFTVGDLETAAGSLTVSGSSSNPTLVPNGNIVFGGSGTSRTVTVTPATNQNGTATITVTVSDGQASAGTSFVLTVNAVNDTPTISSIANQTINEDAATAAIAFTVGDVETAAGSLTVSGSSSNPTLVPNGNIVFGGSGANRTVTLSPATNQNGTATITVTVSDGQATAGTSFVLTVNAVNDAPTISSIANQTINEDAATAAIAFTVGDVETAAGSLTVSGSSSNPTLVPTSNIVFGGSGASRTMTVTPATNQNGTATITVTVSDGQASAGTSFVLTVNAVNDAPTISSIANQTINQDTSTGPISFTVGDVETAAGSLTVSGSSSNPTLVPNSNIVFGGSGSSRTVTVTPAAGQTGTATITVTVSDGSLTAAATFTLTVNSSTAPTYLLSEGFEGTGFENTGWTKIGTPNADYTNTVLFGSQSLNCTGGQRIYRTFSFSNSFYLYLKVRFITLPTYQVLMDWRDANLNTVAEFYMNGGTCNLSHGSVDANSSTTFATGTTYDLWIEWTKGTGSNGTLKLFVATNGTKPASPQVNITTGNGGATSLFTLGPESSGSAIFDRILVDDVAIGSNP